MKSFQPRHGRGWPILSAAQLFAAILSDHNNNAAALPIMFSIRLTTLPFALALLIATATHAQVFCTQTEALARAFPNAQKIQRRTLFLSEEQVQTIAKLAQTPVESKLVTYYVDSTAAGPTGFAFFDKGMVRTKEEVLMIVLNPDGSVRTVEMLAFYEPLDYLPPPRWLKLFQTKFLNDNLWPNRDIHAITGATLSVRAATFSVRKILATYQIAIASASKTMLSSTPREKQ